MSGHHLLSLAASNRLPMTILKSSLVGMPFLERWLLLFWRIDLKIVHLSKQVDQLLTAV